MLNKLIMIFEKLKAIKIQKFSNKLDPSYIAEWENVKKLIDEYQNDIHVLEQLAPYLKSPDEDRDKPGYASMVAEMLRILDDGLSKEVEESVRNDDKIKKEIDFLKNKADRIINKESNYQQVDYEIAQIDEILSYLKSLDKMDYIDSKLITLIYDYLVSEKYISYNDKFINIGGLIAKHNIEVANKRTLI